MLTTGRTTQCFCDIRHIWDDSFDAVAFSLNLGQQHWHAARNVNVVVRKCEKICLPVTVKLVLHREKIMASTKCFEERG